MCDTIRARCLSSSSSPTLRLSITRRVAPPFAESGADTVSTSLTSAEGLPYGNGLSTTALTTLKTVTIEPTASPMVSVAIAVNPGVRAKARTA